MRMVSFNLGILRLYYVRGDHLLQLKGIVYVDLVPTSKPNFSQKLAIICSKGKKRSEFSQEVNLGNLSAQKRYFPCIYYFIL